MTRHFGTPPADAPAVLTYEELVALGGVPVEITSSRAGAFGRGFATAAVPTAGGMGVAVGTSALMAFLCPGVGIGAVLAGTATGVGAGSILQELQRWGLDRARYRDGNGPFSAAQDLADGIEHSLTRKVGALSFALLVVCLWWVVRQPATAFKTVAARLEAAVGGLSAAIAALCAGERMIRFNPLEWRPERRALALASAAGAIVSIAAGFAVEHLRGEGIVYWLVHDPADALTWSVIGALAVGVPIYCYRILSSHSAELGQPHPSRRPVDERIAAAARQRHPGAAPPRAGSDAA